MNTPTTIQATKQASAADRPTEAATLAAALAACFTYINRPTNKQTRKREETMKTETIVIKENALTYDELEQQKQARSKRSFYKRQVINQIKSLASNIAVMKAYAAARKCYPIELKETLNRGTENAIQNEVADISTIAEVSATDFCEAIRRGKKQPHFSKINIKFNLEEVLALEEALAEEATEEETEE